jgi:signal recognition particle subunit SRP54
MFDLLSEKLEGALRKIRGRGVLSTADVENALREVRMALLEADVHFQVARGYKRKRLAKPFSRAFHPTNRLSN